MLESLFQTSRGAKITGLGVFAYLDQKYSLRGKVDLATEVVVNQLTQTILPLLYPPHPARVELSTAVRLADDAQGHNSVTKRVVILGGIHALIWLLSMLPNRTTQAAQVPETPSNNGSDGANEHQITDVEPTNERAVEESDNAEGVVEGVVVPKEDEDEVAKKSPVGHAYFVFPKSCSKEDEAQNADSSDLPVELRSFQA